MQPCRSAGGGTIQGQEHSEYADSVPGAGPQVQHGTGDRKQTHKTTRWGILQCFRPSFIAVYQLIILWGE